MEPEVSSRYGETNRLRMARRGVIIPIDLIVTSLVRYAERSLVSGTVEHTARTEERAQHDDL
jgi:hypothetical protein